MNFLNGAQVVAPEVINTNYITKILQEHVLDRNFSLNVLSMRGLPEDRTDFSSLAHFKTVF